MDEVDRDTRGAVTTLSADRASLDEFAQHAREAVDGWLDRALPPAASEPATLHSAMRHSVFAGGKRIRPLLLLATAEIFEDDLEPLLPAAAALELIHTYSLIHDDLPAFDDDDLRRGRPTCHKLFGDAVAILAGDALQTLAFEQLTCAAAALEHPRRWLAASAAIARAAGSIGMCGGQCLDIEASGRALEFEDLRSMHAAKTGALLAASTEAGALLAGADADATARLAGFGRTVGLAFQVVDDLLDVEGTLEELGKPPGSDSGRDQPTFVTHLGLDGARREAEDLRDQALELLAPFGGAAQHLHALANLIVERRA